MQTFKLDNGEEFVLIKDNYINTNKTMIKVVSINSNDFGQVIDVLTLNNNEKMDSNEVLLKFWDIDIDILEHIKNSNYFINTLKKVPIRANEAEIWIVNNKVFTTVKELESLLNNGVQKNMSMTKQYKVSCN